MIDKPQYTIEEKAAAFDMLWETLGSGEPIFLHYIAKYKKDQNSIEREMIPVFEFSIRFVGDCYSFKDVLHSNLIAAKQRPYI